MADATVNQAGNTATIEAIDILWLTAGLGCDGDTIAMTGATQPSIEDVVMGALPWIPKVKFYNPFLAYEVGDEFVKPFRDAADGMSELPQISFEGQAAFLVGTIGPEGRDHRRLSFPIRRERARFSPIAELSDSRSVSRARFGRDRPRLSARCQPLPA